MIAMRYGAVPVARRTGGLADTVIDAGDPGGNGILFDELSARASVADALERALAVYADAGRWEALQLRGHAERTSPGARSAAAYTGVYERARTIRLRQVAGRPGMRTTRAVILAGGEGSRLGVLTDKRAKPAAPFAGKYRDHRFHPFQLRQLRDH